MEKKMNEDERLRNEARTRQANEDYLEEEKKGRETEGRRGKEAQERGVKAREGQVKVLQEMQKFEREREELRVNIANQERERAFQVVEINKAKQSKLDQESEATRLARENEDHYFAENLPGKRLKYYGSSTFEKTTFHNNYLVVAEKNPEAPTAIDNAKIFEETEKEVCIQEELENREIRESRAQHRGREALRQISQDKFVRRLEESAERTKKDERGKRLKALACKPLNEDRTEAIDSKRKKKQSSMDKKFLDRFSVSENNKEIRVNPAFTPQNGQPGTLDQNRVMDRGEKMELLAHWEVSKDKWWEHKKTRR
jgi:hypothetical protein